MIQTAHDLHHATRRLWASRNVTALVVLIIALGIGANVAIFSMVNGIRRPLPVRDPGQIVVLAAQTKGDETGFRYRFSFPALGDFRKQTDIFADVFAFNDDLTGFTVGGKASQFLYSVVTGNYFSGLGVKPAAGRLFEPGEGEHSGADSVVVLGYAFWQKQFGGDRGVVGRQVRIGGRTARVIGITPKEFHGTYTGVEMDGYMPLSAQLGADDTNRERVFTNRTIRPLTVLARLRSGVSVNQAQTELSVVARRMEEQYPVEKGIGVRVIPEIWARPVPLSILADAGPVVRVFLLILCAVVLLLACMNVANLLMVQATARQREMAIRAALGSGRARLIRQSLIEGGLLSLLGLVAGLILGNWGSRALAGSIDLATDFPIFLDFSFDWRVFAYAALAAVATGILIGIW